MDGNFVEVELFWSYGIHENALKAQDLNASSTELQRRIIRTELRRNKFLLWEPVPVPVPLGTKKNKKTKHLKFLGH